jgi:hypothetical protein
MKRGWLVVAIVIAACGAKQPGTGTGTGTGSAGTGTGSAGTGTGIPGMAAGIQPDAWLVGDWVSDDGKSREHWLAAAGALYGVRFTGGDFTCFIIDDAGDGGALVRWTYAHGEANGPLPAVDEPKKTGDVTMTSGGITFHRGLGDPAPALEQADQDFYVATRDRGADGWTDYFDVEGVNWGGGQIVKGHDAIKADIAGLLGKAKLEWKPVGSRMGPGKDLGFTVGTFVVMKDGKAVAQGSYETVWKQQPDGTWKVIADGGRPEN